MSTEIIPPPALVAGMISIPRPLKASSEELRVPASYKSKEAKNERTFDAFEWLAAMAPHILNKGEQMFFH